MTDCSVCDDEIEQETPGPQEGYGGESYAPAQTEFQGEVHYFCCSDHKEAFESDPEEYADS
ncbi:YHS domain-containing protein [Halalkalicoccus tibetensis]|uniref:YHS domain-containing protein n=1 Tax=Halalkalicoccus tibetensis TaxID=175632 RepID=A0ABD5V415_9EURY